MCPRLRPAQAGFLLPMAIFLLVALAAIAAFMLHVHGGSQAAGALDLQGARAYQAARAGAEFGLYRTLRNGVCPAAPSVLPAAVYPGFAVSWTCSATTYTENGAAQTLYLITSTASYGSVESNDYVERQIRVTAGAPANAP